MTKRIGTRKCKGQTGHEHRTRQGTNGSSLLERVDRAMSGQSEQRGQGNTLRSARVLVLDSCKDRRRRAVRSIRAHGYSSVEAASPLEAIHHLQDSPPINVAAIARSLSNTNRATFRSFLEECFPGVHVVEV